MSDVQNVVKPALVPGLNGTVGIELQAGAEEGTLVLVGKLKDGASTKPSSFLTKDLWSAISVYRETFYDSDDCAVLSIMYWNNMGGHTTVVIFRGDENGNQGVQVDMEAFLEALEAFK